ncbi:hypothetical protein GCK32_000414 [Trichostrongylus colubriformis]|uniref:Peroxisomal ATPase PEX1 n=1 Tax=Trichostrongylus colubriformis TaxID=6319 RepID=A0AAN8IHM1_TRICO
MTRVYPSFIDFHDFQNCFAYVRNTPSHVRPLNVSRNLFSNVSLGYFRIRCCGKPQRHLYVQVFGSLPFTHVLVSRRLASMANFDANTEVILEQVSPTVCSSLEIVPLSQRDYEILDECSEEVEDVFLQQIRVVFLGMKFPLWVSSNVCVDFRVGGALPETKEPVLLLPSTELHVLSGDMGSSSSTDEEFFKKTMTIKGAFPLIIGTRGFSQSLSPLDFSEKQFRVLPSVFSKLVIKKSNTSSYSFYPDIYILGDDFASKTSGYAVHGVMSMRSHLDPSTVQFVMVEAVSPASVPRSTHVKSLLKFLKPDHCIAMNKHCLAYSTISLRPIEEWQMISVQSVDVYFSREDMEWVLNNNVQQHVSSALRSVVLVNPLLLPLTGIFFSVSVRGRDLMLHLSPTRGAHLKKYRLLQYCCFVANAACIFILKLEASLSSPTALSSSEPENYGFVTHNASVHIECQTKVIKELSRWAEYSWYNAGFGHALLLGLCGSGKSSVAALVAQKLAKAYCCLSVRIDCSSWKGKTAEIMYKCLVSEIKSLSKRAPSLLILDNIEFLNQIGEEEGRQLGFERVLQLLRCVMSKSATPILMVTKQSNLFHQSVVKPGGRRLFAFIKHLPPLTQEEHSRLLNQFLKSGSNPSIAVETTKGFSLLDLRHLAVRAEIHAEIRAASSPITKDDFEQALAHSRSPANFGTRGEREIKLSLDDVGGMESEKRTLLEVLTWPTKHARVLNSYGICLGRGVLLHGPSGCGKTLLAKAVVAHSKFNSIFIKGPELLSKYIGSSEGNIRKVFQRARDSSPCVIIFDEFDSLAPQRGSDTTGVTDRVVNQLLTEMDGVESCSGVFVIGCSSRIDLIDSALLRPGRFDHVLECRRPDEMNRADILKVLLRSVDHDPAVINDGWAARTSGWTGADLKALITNAHFDATRRRHDVRVQGDGVIKTVNIENVFKDSQPRRQSFPRRATVGEKVTLW